MPRLECLKNNWIRQSAGKSRIGKPSTTKAEMPVGVKRPRSGGHPLIVDEDIVWACMRIQEINRNRVSRNKPEIEKLLSGTGSSNQTDGGTTDRVMGKILAWMQEKESPVFVIATANRIDTLPPELLRKGRFDDFFFVGMPDKRERKAIFEIHIKKNKRKPLSAKDMAQVVELSEDFTGAEIEAVVIDAMFHAFDKDEQMGFKHIALSLKQTKPLAQTQPEIIERMKQWAREKARFANDYEEVEVIQQQDFISETPNNSLLLGSVLDERNDFEEVPIPV